MRKIHESILKWYNENGRKNLPWRILHKEYRKYGSEDDLKKLKNIDNAYAVYISEIMLQQTQVKSVLQNYYFQFLAKFPSLKALSMASEDEVLKAWQGLGYYTRARNIHKCAKICVQEFNAKLPFDIKELQKLPGIGEYTAGAIACFGFLQAKAFVDANIKRVLSRFYSLQNPNSKLLTQKAKEFLNYDNAFDHNQALLDIGALICLPKNAKCKLCPIESFCSGKNEYEKFHVSKKTQYENIILNILIVQKNEQFLLIKSKEKLYFNMYNFLEYNKEKNAKFIGEFKHSYTKYKINAKVYFLKDDDFEDLKVKAFSYKELEHLALSKLALKAFELFKKSDYAF
ncbi:A/G-specific adenine glycosylase [Campylobacter lari]|uniref:A/G-specific adenine glycosylase n=1 Tax=Campylobacter sp. CNRCH_2013_0898h TaxID=2911601 RepID=UPI00127C1D6B|nr:A/G-specific adenine glycosylase [Campylobacter sp. CNRCH_2013_0898h]EAI4449374.1 A/G-specific adenine glycosylase [Campylobacter lari]EAK0440839.1 A/G-specific adenine glycosylase [Campylobacter lari]EGK8092140.1 A/G-specific adenine glycosylase [Campylobacter lari]MCV3553105.1 A/G-specific adenine glycosylase [Campylobacter sp. CNRCH_2013_0898h]